MANIIQINGFGISSSNAEGDFVPSTWTGSSASQFSGTASLASTASYALNAISASRALTASYFASSNASISDNGSGNITFNTVRTIISASNSIILQSNNTISLTGTTTLVGDLRPGNPITNNTSSWSLGSTSAAWKDLYVSNGSINFVGPTGVEASISYNNASNSVDFSGATVTIPTGSVVPTASFALTSSLALTSSAVAVINDNAPTTRYVPFVTTSGSGVSRPVNNLLTNTNFSYVPASNTLSVTSSWANNTVSSSFASTASYINNGVSFAGSGSIITGSVAISASYGLLIPANTFAVGDIVKIQGVFTKPNAGTATY